MSFEAYDTTWGGNHPYRDPAAWRGDGNAYRPPSYAHGTSSAKGKMPSGYMWSASSYLAVCPYCGAQPFERCHVYGEPTRPAQFAHSGRSFLGHDILRRILMLDNSKTDLVALTDDEPPIPPPSEDDIVSLVNRLIDERLSKPSTRRRPSASAKSPRKQAVSK